MSTAAAVPAAPTSPAAPAPTSHLSPTAQLSPTQRRRVEAILASLTWEEKLNQIQVTFKMSQDECLEAARAVWRTTAGAG